MFVVIGNQQWPILRRHVERVVGAVNAATPGSFTKWKFLSSDPLHLAAAKMFFAETFTE
jgi:hypothetical protein